MADGGARHLAHHFEDLEQQHQAASLGMWVFLVTEVMFFGGALLTYVVYRARYADAFAHASHHLDVTLGTFNTVVLITSSLTMALSVWSAAADRRRTLVGMLSATMLLGSVFLVVKGYEYAHKFHEHLVPGPFFRYPGPDAPEAELFFSVYFILTGIHALHMVIGIGCLAYLLLRARRGAFTAAWSTPVEMVGLYWHFVDIVWIFLFPLLYLIGRHA
ncbi:MAG TPA: cytochrome c oxidase subunit 3 family protein [Candidatus Limnocylindria bacterium]|nr:cytochrome c oxidase subunit 3 family protein [Candidatus Limnocylindria bacterium]